LLGKCITDAVQILISEKHLYQSHAVAKPTHTADPRTLREYQEFVAAAEKSSWNVEMLGLQHSKSIGMHDTWWSAPQSAKLYCEVCERVEAFAPILSVELTPQNSGASLAFGAPLLRFGREDQNEYALKFVCQSCKKTTSAFLIRRDGFRLTLTGRSPMEHVEVPGFIPKDLRQYYTVAVVAHQSGQTLCGLFMLRTMLEQWTYKQDPGKTDAVSAMESYMASLPSAFKQQFPSMAALYGSLSAAVHRAEASSALFERSIGEILEHFDARGLFKL
jgi:hypothetical protein